MNEANLNPSTGSSRKVRSSPRGEKVTVGVYLPKKLVEKARKLGLNLSKTLIEALNSILASYEDSNSQNKGGFGTVGSELAGPPGIEPGTYGLRASTHP
ncbi:MAG: type II toxin-antitoxin system CcdA family antitoxin, partial [Candidatus Bathyarchaeia archaeon]